MKTLLKKIVNDTDLKESGFNFATIYFASKIASTISNAVFHFDLNQYHSTEHFAIGVGLGTFAYRKADGGIKGILAGLAAATILNASWESFENLVVFKNTQLDVDTILDISMIYAGTTLSFLGEKFKSYINKDDVQAK